MNKHLTRRRFLTATVALVGSTALPACKPQPPSSSNTYRVASATEVAKKMPYYPPALMGLRGDHDGSQSQAHGVALRGKQFTLPTQAEEQYDLVVIGAGMSGLTSAYYYQQKQPQAKILILDNHDDFGGHAKRNEFVVDGKTLITYGGSESLDAPEHSFSKQAHALLTDLGVDYKKLGSYFDQDLYDKKWQLKRGIFFNQNTFGQNAVIKGMPIANTPEAKAIIEQFPLPDADKQALIELYTAPQDYLKGKSRRQKQSYAESTSYYDFLKDQVKLPEKALAFLTNLSMDYWGHPINAISLEEAISGHFGETDADIYAGVSKLGLPIEKEEKEPYIYHFPDGNASITRLVVRKLIPSIASGNTMEDIVTAKFDYEQLDKPEHNVRIRLNSTALRVENTASGVGIAYITAGDEKLHLVQAKKCIYAGHATLASYIMPEMSDIQKTAMKSNVKIPMIYAKVALKNAKAWQKLGISEIYIPNSPYCLMQLDDPVNIGNYQHAKTPDEPIVLHCVRIATAFDGKDAREKYRNGRRHLMKQQLADLEKELLDVLRGIYELAGEKVEDVVAGLTLNRWAHGYSYEQVMLWDSDESTESTTAMMQKKIGNIFMANSDIAWMPYLQNAIDEGYRAVTEALA